MQYTGLSVRIALAKHRRQSRSGRQLRVWRQMGGMVWANTHPPLARRDAGGGCQLRSRSAAGPRSCCDRSCCPAVAQPHCHKELRFIYPALPPLLIVCGLGTAKLFGAPALARLRPYGAIAPVGAWMILSFAVAVAPQMRLAWGNRAANLQAWRTLSADHQICGIGLRYPDVGWWDPGGEVELGRDVPLYAFSTPQGAARTLASFNAALGARNLGEALAGFRLTHCWSAASKEICMFRAEPNRKCLADPSVALNGLHDLGRVNQNGLRADASE